MRSVLKSTLAALLLTGALSAMVATSASAREFTIEGKPIAPGQQVPFSSENGTAEIHFNGVEITCSTVKDTGDLLAKGESEATIELTNCHLISPANCTAHEPIVVHKAGESLTLGRLVTYEGKPADRLPVKNFELEFSNSGGTCSISGNWGVYGTIQGWVANGETEATEHSLTVGSLSGSTLTLGGGPLGLNLTSKIALSGLYSGEKWSTSTPEFMVNEKAIAAGTTVPFESKNVSGKTMLLEGTELHVECKTTKGSGMFKAGGESSFTAEYSSCTVSEPAHCQIAEPIKLNSNNQLGLFEGAPADTFYPNNFPTEQRLTTLEFSNNGGTCYLGEEVHLDGILQAAVESPTTKTTEHTLAVKASGGEEIEMGGTPVALKLKETVKLSGAYAGSEWDVS